MTEPATLTGEQRRQRLDFALAGMTAQGWQIESQGQLQAVVASGQSVNNVLHAILTIFTCGVWLVVWMLVSVTNKTARQTVYVDEWGRLLVNHGGGWVAADPKFR